MLRTPFLLAWLLLPAAVTSVLGAAPGQVKERQENPCVTVVDQLGRTVTVPINIQRVVTFHFMAGKIVFALGRQDKLVSQSLLRNEGKAMARIDPVFAAKPLFMSGQTTNIEVLMALRPDVAIVYASFDKAEVEQMEKAGIKVVAVKGETFAEGYEAVRLIGKILGCEDRAEAYIKECNKLLNLVKGRITHVQRNRRPRVLFLGPKGAYDVATGDMLQSAILSAAGAENVASGLKGRWPTVSPEQIVAWNPDVVFLGSGWGGFGADKLLNNPQLKAVRAVRNRKVFDFPSNIGWWDFPAPHCALGVVWAAKTLYPDRFMDLSMQEVADNFYTRYLGYSFTSLGGKLTP